jgi:hypothetical protein
MHCIPAKAKVKNLVCRRWLQWLGKTGNNLELTNGSKKHGDWQVHGDSVTEKAHSDQCLFIVYLVRTVVESPTANDDNQ